MSCLFHFSFFVFWQSDQKRKNQLSCLFIFFIKYPHFAWKWQLIFSFLVTLTKKRKTEWTRQKDRTSRQHLENLKIFIKNTYSYQNNIQNKKLKTRKKNNSLTFPYVEAEVEDMTRSADVGPKSSSTEQGDCWSLLRPTSLVTAATASPATPASTPAAVAAAASPACSAASMDTTGAFSCWIVDGVMMIWGWSCPESSDIMVAMDGRPQAYT